MTGPASEFRVNFVVGETIIEKHDLTSRAHVELESAVAEITKHYEMFVSKHKRFIRIQDDVQMAIAHAESEGNFRRSLEVFENKLSFSLKVMERKHVDNDGCNGRLNMFLPKLYGIIKLGLQATSTCSSVS